MIPLTVRLNEHVSIPWSEFAPDVSRFWDEGHDTKVIARLLSLKWQTPVGEHVVANNLPTVRQHRSIKRAA